MANKVKWKSAPDEHNYPAAEEYLSLLMHLDDAAEVVRRLRKANDTTYKAKDIIRASRLPVLPLENPYVQHHVDKLRVGESLSPVLLVRSDPLIIADGYHRVCASYWMDQDSPVRAKIVAQ